MDIHETFLHDGVHRRTTADEVLQLASERVSQTALDAALEEIADDRHVPERADRPFGERGVEFLLVDLLDDQGHGDHQVGLHVLEGFEQDGRGRALGQEIDMRPGAKGVQQLAYLAEHVCQRKHGDEALSRIDGQHLHADLDVVTQRPSVEHDALGAAGRAGGIVDEGELVGIGGEGDIFGLDTLRVFGFEELVDGFLGRHFDSFRLV